MTSTTSAASRRRRGGADGARRSQTLSLAGAELERRSARGRAGGLRPAGARDCDDVRAEAEQPRERDLGGCRAVRLGDLAEHLPAGKARRAARPAERRMGDQRDTRLGASLDHADAERLVVDHAQGNLHRGDRSELERFVQLAAVHVRERRRATPDRPRRAGRARAPTCATAFAGRERGGGRGRSGARRVPRGSPRSPRGSPSRGRRGPRPRPVAPCRPSSRSAQSRRRRTRAEHGRAAARCGRARPLRARTRARCRTP